MRNEINIYIQHLESMNFSPDTCFHRWRALRRFMIYLNQRRMKQAQDITPEDIRDYQASMIDQQMANNSLETNSYALKGFFNFLFERGLVFENPATDMNARFPNNLLPVVLNPEDMQTVFDAIDTNTPTGIRNRAILELLYSTGMRRGELLALTLTSFSYADSTVRVTGKGRKQRLIPVGTHAMT